MDEYQRKSDSESGKIACTFFRIGSPQNNEYEYECEEHLCKEAAENSDSRAACIGSCVCCILDVNARCEEVKDGGCNDGSDYLEEHIH